MLHNLLDKNVYVVELYCLKHWSRFNLDEIDEVLKKEDLLGKILVQRTAFKNKYREIITGLVFEVYAERGITVNEDFSPIVFERRYPYTNTFICLYHTFDRETGVISNRNYEIASLDAIKDYVNRHVDKEKYYNYLYNLKEEGKVKDQEKQILRTLKRNR